MPNYFEKKKSKKQTKNNYVILCYSILGQCSPPKSPENIRKYLFLLCFLGAK